MYSYSCQIFKSMDDIYEITLKHSLHLMLFYILITTWDEMPYNIIEGSS